MGTVRIRLDKTLFEVVREEYEYVILLAIAFLAAGARIAYHAYWNSRGWGF